MGSNLLSPGSTSFVSSGASVHSDISDDESDTESEDSAPSPLTVEVAGVSLVAMALRTRCTHSYTDAESASFMFVVIVGRRVYIPDINTTCLNDTWRIVICNIFQVYS